MRSHISSTEETAHLNILEEWAFKLIASAFYVVMHMKHMNMGCSHVHAQVQCVIKLRKKAEPQQKLGSITGSLAAKLNPVEEDKKNRWRTYVLFNITLNMLD